MEYMEKIRKHHNDSLNHQNFKKTGSLFQGTNDIFGTEVENQNDLEDWTDDLDILFPKKHGLL